MTQPSSSSPSPASTLKNSAGPAAQPGHGVALSRWLSDQRPDHLVLGQADQVG